jgi:hypothetical protein
MTGLEFQIMNEQMREMRLLAQALLDEIEMEMKPLESTGSEQSGGSQGR